MTMLAINANIRQKRFQIPIHLGLGHEAIAVAVSQTKITQTRLSDFKPSKYALQCCQSTRCTKNI